MFIERLIKNICVALFAQYQQFWNKVKCGIMRICIRTKYVFNSILTCALGYIRIVYYRRVRNL